MTLRELETKIEEYKAEIKESGFERPLTDDEIGGIESSLENIPREYLDIINSCNQNNYGEFEKLPHFLRNYLGALALRQFREKFGDAPSLEDEGVRQYLDQNLMNAALRAGISAEKSQDSTKKTALALDTYMNAGLMKKTMMPPSEQTKFLLLDYYTENEANEMVEKAMARQLVMAKTMLLAQIGKYDVIDKNGLSHELDVPVYETLVHGNRTNFVLPAGEASGNVIDAFMGAGRGAAAGIEKRTAATHSVKLRKVKNNGALGSESKELRTYNPLRIFGNQYGMNIAAGGLGELGPDKKLITGNGESGHMYMRAEKGDAEHCGSLLIGIEGSEPGKSNYLGNSHGIMAKSAKQSAFLADKSIAGKKIGGRQIDLSAISAENLTGILNQFSEKYSELQRDPESREKLAKLNDMLMGKHMEIDAILEMFASLDMADQNLHDIISQARSGYTSKIDPKDITRDEFIQSIRAGFSQEKACNIAKARFEYAGDDLELATGAVKELIFTHETRSLIWKIRHPIKNYLENSTISSLMKKLETEKGFDREQIASAFGYYNDTFAMDWGSGLSNDRDAVRFERFNKYNFKPSDDKLFNLMKKYHKDMNVEIRKDVNTEIRGEEEVEEMQEELLKIQNGEELDSGRESITVEEENEANKSIEVSEEVFPEQTILENRKGF